MEYLFILHCSPYSTKHKCAWKEWDISKGDLGENYHAIQASKPVGYLRTTSLRVSSRLQRRNQSIPR